MELFAKRMTWELDNEEGLSCLFFELEDGYFTLSRKTGAEALRLEMNDPANGLLIAPDCFSVNCFFRRKQKCRWQKSCEGITMVKIHRIWFNTERMDREDHYKITLFSRPRVSIHVDEYIWSFIEAVDGGGSPCGKGITVCRSKLKEVLL